MRRIVIALLVGALLLISALVVRRESIDADTALTLAGHYLVFCGTVLVFYQIRIGVVIEKRRATADFIYGPVIETLQPLEIALRDLLDRQFLLFSENDPDLAALLSSDLMSAEEKRLIEQYAVQILSFYERMGLLITLGVLDNDLCYDDKGLTAVSFFRWTTRYRRILQESRHSRVFGNVEALYEHWDLRLSTDSAHPRRRKGTTPAEKLGVIPKGILGD
jgi:hypothetical protein